eukprot:10925816-Prorocentrum_lima.AAC.1
MRFWHPLGAASPADASSSSSPKSPPMGICALDNALMRRLMKAMPVNVRAWLTTTWIPGPRTKCCLCRWCWMLVLLASTVTWKPAACLAKAHVPVMLTVS